MRRKLSIALILCSIIVFWSAPGECKGNVLNRVFMPSWINGEQLFLDRIIESGFDGFEVNELVISTKGYYFYNLPYGNILAAIVPDEAQYLNPHNFSRWNIDKYNSSDQYFDLSLIPGMPFSVTAVNPNLCGFFVLSKLLDIDPAYFIVNTWYSYPWIREYLLDFDEGITRDEMIPLFEDYGWSVVHPDNVFANNNCNDNFNYANENDLVGEDFLCYFKGMLANDFAPIMLTDLSTKHGVLVAEKFCSGQSIVVVEHWVVVLQIISSKDGFSYVRIYNPYNNREEMYTWNDFFYSWTGVDQGYKDMFFVRPKYSEE